MNSKLNQDIVAISDLPAGQTAGAIVLWRLSGTAKHDDLFAQLAQEGFSQLCPELPSAPVALKRAMREQENKRLLVRTLPGKGTGYALVAEMSGREEQGTSPLEYAVVLTAKLVDGDALEIHPADAPVSHQIQEDFTRNLETLDTGDLGGWLCQMARHVSAVPLRDTGGVYFVPKETLPTWQALTRALKAASFVYTAEIPALTSKDALEAVLDALNREADTFIEGISRELQDSTGLSQRVVDSRLRKCGSTLEKVEIYERLLGVKLESIRERVGKLQARTAALLLTETQESQ